MILPKKSYEELFTKHPFLRDLQFTEKCVVFPDGKIVEIGSHHEIGRKEIERKEGIIRHHIYEKNKCRELYKQIRKVPLTIESIEVINLKPDFTTGSIENKVPILDGLPCTNSTHWTIEEII